MLAVKRAATSARRENSVLAFTLGGFDLLTSLIRKPKVIIFRRDIVHFGIDEYDDPLLTYYKVALSIL